MCKDQLAHGTFRDRRLAELALANLKLAGFRATDIGFVSAESAESLKGLDWLCDVKRIALDDNREFMVAGPLSFVHSKMNRDWVLRDLLASCGIPADQSEVAAKAVLAGRTLMILYCDNDYWVRRAMELLDNSGASAVTGVGLSGLAKGAGGRAMAGGGRHWD
jgi:hypothetical protein